MTVTARTAQTAATNAVVKHRKKKGPRRLNKSNIHPKTLAQLDQDMEEYRASADGQKSGQ
jgi:THO complex subunit 4